MREDEKSLLLTQVLSRLLDGFCHQSETHIL